MVIGTVVVVGRVVRYSRLVGTVGTVGRKSDQDCHLHTGTSINRFFYFLFLSRRSIDRSDRPT